MYPIKSFAHLFVVHIELSIAFAVVDTFGPLSRHALYILLSALSLLALLQPCAVLPAWIFKVTNQHLRHDAPAPAPSVLILPQKIAGISKQLILDFQDLEKELLVHSHPHPRHPIDTNAKASKVLTVDSPAHITPEPAAPKKAHRNTGTSKNIISIEVFWERVVLMNQIWRQEREIKALRSSLKSLQKALNDAEFTAFLDRVLLSNKVWRQEDEIKKLRSKLVVEEKIGRTNRAHITRIAERMALDVRKEHLVEELVQELVDELEDNKRRMKEMRATHLKEVEELTSEWVKDYRRLSRELEKLKLGQRAKAVEQEVANEMEQSLFDGLRECRTKKEELEGRIAHYEATRSTILSKSNVKSLDEQEETYSDLSDASTCVSVNNSTSPYKSRISIDRRSRSPSSGIVKPYPKITKRRPNSTKPREPYAHACSKNHGLRSIPRIPSDSSSKSLSRPAHTQPGPECLSLNPLLFARSATMRDGPPGLSPSSDS